MSLLKSINQCRRFTIQGISKALYTKFVKQVFVRCQKSQIKKSPAGVSVGNTSVLYGWVLRCALIMTDRKHHRGSSQTTETKQFLAFLSEIIQKSREELKACSHPALKSHLSCNLFIFEGL